MDLSIKQEIRNAKFVNQVTYSNTKQLCGLARRINKSVAFHRRCLLTTLLNIDCFSPRVMGMKSRKLRFSDFKYVLKQLKELRGYFLEQESFIYKTVGVGEGCEKYVCSRIKALHHETVLGAEKWAKTTEVFLRKGERRFSVKMKGLIPSADDKKNEIYTDMLAIQGIAEEKGLYQVLITFTAPPIYHANPSQGKNSYQRGLSSRDGYREVKKYYRAFYKEVKRAGIEVMGFTSVEPHKDGTAHIHCGWYVDEDSVFLLEGILERIENRTKVRNDLCDKQAERDRREYEGEGVASAATYVLKYVRKSFDDPDVAAWYSRDCGGSIRRFGACGVKGYKAVFNYLWKSRDQLLGQDGLFGEIGKLLNHPKKPLSQIKKEYILNFAEKVKAVYAGGTNRYGEKVKGGRILYVYEISKGIYGEEEKSASGVPAMLSAFMPEVSELMSDTEMYSYLSSLGDSAFAVAEEFVGSGVTAANDDEFEVATVKPRFTSIDRNKFLDLTPEERLCDLEDILSI